MRLRRVVPQIQPQSLVPLELPLYNNRFILTHSESTLPQGLIPLRFNSLRISVYKKTGEGVPLFAQKVCNSSLPACWSCAHTRTPATPIRSYIYFISRAHPGGGGPKEFPILPRLLCKNRSANAPGISLGNPHLPRGAA